MKIKLLIKHVNMGNGHDGLAAIAAKFKSPVTELQGQEVIMFLNRAGDKLKILGHEGVVIGYLRMPKGRKIYLEALQWLPKTFHASGRIDYNAALKEALSSAMEKREREKLSPLEAYRLSKAS